MDIVDLHRLGLVSSRLHNFQMVVQLGTIRRAAEVMGVAPSAISRTVRQLEERLGTALFERVGQRLKLTSAGEALSYHARASHGNLARAFSEIQDLHGLRRGKVSIATVESIARGMLRTVVSRFWERNSNVTVDVQMGGSEEAVEALMTGACDLALAFDVRLPRGVRRLATTELGIGALVTPNHRLAGRGAAQLRDFANEPVLLADMSLSLGRMVEELAAKEELELQIRARSNSIEELVAMAVQGLGTTFQIRAGVEREIERGELIYLPLSDRLLKPRKLSLLVYGQSRLPEAQAGLASLITEAMEALAAS